VSKAGLCPLHSASARHARRPWTADLNARLSAPYMPVPAPTQWRLDLITRNEHDLKAAFR